MPRKRILILFVICYLLFVPFLSPVFGQDLSCDLCGWCTTDIQNKPADWNKCMQCLFPTYASSLGIDTNYAGPRPIPDPEKAFYPSTPEVSNEVSKHWTVFGCLDTAPGGFVTQIYKIIIAIGSGFAFLAFVYGGFQVLTAGGDPTKVKAGKNIIMGAIFGILLIVFSLFFLRFIGFEIIKIPGFG